MFPLLERDRPNPLELFQIWLNLPARDKLVDPYFTMFWSDDIPQVTFDGGEVTVLAGALGDVTPPAPPPNSWASRPDSDVAIWHIRLDPGARWTLPAAAGGSTTQRVLYVFEGDALHVGGTDVPNDTGAALDPTVDVELVAGAAEVEMLLLQGRPIGEPVSRYGPFVMNTKGEIEQAMRDYQDTGFGGWPWDDEAPTHGADRGRFARHVDGRVEELTR
jgi:redox-sensitive bicupin YhaK (pirin superfamily)